MRKRRPYMAPAALLGLAWLVQTGAATVGSAVASKSAEARQHYQRGEFEAALRLYRDAKLEDPHSPLLHYNVGDALFKLGDYPAARREFEAALASPEPALRESTLYNIGNTHFREQQFGPAVEAYKQALELDPDNLDAKANLELALQYLEQEEQPQEQQSQQQEQQEQEKQQDGQQNQEQQDQPQREEDQQRSDERREPQEQHEQQEPSGAQEQQRAAGEEDEERMSPEEAERILLGLRDQEKDAQVRRFKATVPVQGKDW